MASPNVTGCVGNSGRNPCSVGVSWKGLAERFTASVVAIGGEKEIGLPVDGRQLARIEYDEKGNASVSRGYLSRDLSRYGQIASLRGPRLQADGTTFIIHPASRWLNRAAIQHWQFAGYFDRRFPSFEFWFFERNQRWSKRTVDFVRINSGVFFFWREKRPFRFAFETEVLTRYRGRVL